jgi:hypothetical protein
MSQEPDKSGTQTPLTTEPESKQSVHRLIWTTQSEELLACWADIAMCYKTLHELAYRKYNETNYYFAIPIIILSTLTGTLNVGLASYVPTEFTSYAQAGIGAINIFTGILTTLSAYFRFAQLSEAHSNASVGWSKLQRNISIELRIECQFRKDADNFIKMCRQDYDRLLEQSPMIPSDIVNQFNKKFQKLDGLMVPDICGDQLKHTLVHREVQSSKLPLEISEMLTRNYESQSAPNPEVEELQKIREEIKQEKDLIDFTYKKLQQTTNGNPDGEMQEVITQDGPKWRYIDNRARRMSHMSKPQEHKFSTRSTSKSVDIVKPTTSVKDLIKRFTVDNGQLSITEPVEETSKDATEEQSKEPPTASVHEQIESILDTPEYKVEIKGESDQEQEYGMFYPIGTVSPRK